MSESRLKHVVEHVNERREQDRIDKISTESLHVIFYEYTEVGKQSKMSGDVVDRRVQFLGIRAEVVEYDTERNREDRGIHQNGQEILEGEVNLRNFLGRTVQIDFLSLFRRFFRFLPIVHTNLITLHAYCTIAIERILPPDSSSCKHSDKNASGVFYSEESSKG